MGKPQTGNTPLSGVFDRWDFGLEPESERLGPDLWCSCRPRPDKCLWPLTQCSLGDMLSRAPGRILVVQRRSDRARCSRSTCPSISRQTLHSYHLTYDSGTLLLTHLLASVVYVSPNVEDRLQDGPQWPPTPGSHALV